jgi:hypothetical protein
VPEDAALEAEMEAYILVAYVFWGLAFGWAIYAMLVALGLARPLMN